MPGELDVLQRTLNMRKNAYVLHVTYCVNYSCFDKLSCTQTVKKKPSSY